MEKRDTKPWFKTEDEKLLNTKLWECKCGELIEIHNDADIERYVCPSCKRTGCWIEQF